MKRSPLMPVIVERRCPIRLIAAAGVLVAILQACMSPDEETNLAHFPETVSIENPSADSVVFWPLGLRYARTGDTLFAQIRGLKRQAECAVLLSVNWNFRLDTTGNEHYRARSRFRIPAGSSCLQDPVGIDTTFKVRFYTKAAKTLYLETPDSAATDSALFVSELSQVDVVTFTRPPGAPDSVVNGRFVFRDSTAKRPRRSIRSDSLATCEIMQVAVYDLRGDTLVVRMRRIEAVALPDTVLQACAGPHADSIEVSFNRHNFFR